jgi:uncharacterized protein YidB (DUF937 family)
MKWFFNMIWQICARILGRKIGSEVTSSQGGDVLGQLFGKGKIDLNDILSKFQSGGLKDQVASWVGTGKNLPISREQVEKALGSAGLGNLAAKLGIPAGKASQLLADHLPDHVDRLTPDGAWPRA